MRITVRDQTLVYFTKKPDEWLTCEIAAEMFGCDRTSAWGAFRAMERDGLVATKIEKHRKIVSIGPALQAMVDA